MKTDDGRIVVVSGASRSGKTAMVRKLLAKARRVWAWDPEDQWAQMPGYTRATNRKDLSAAITKAGPQKIAYVTGGDLKEEFNFFCQCAMYAGRYVEAMNVIAEELADVTSQGKAPGHWGILIRRGLKRGISIYPISQRWAEADKTAMGNASEFILFRCATGDDARYLERKTGVPADELATMAPLYWVKKDNLTGKISRGKLTF
jgi:hypothetical protein